MFNTKLISFAFVTLISLVSLVSAGEMEKWGHITSDKFFSYITDPNWGKAHELANLASQSSALKQNMGMMKAEINSAKSYVVGELPALSKQTSWASSTELGVRKILGFYDFAAQALDVVSNSPRTDLNRNIVPSSGRIGDILRIVQPEQVIQGFVHSYAERNIEGIWQPINQRIDAVQYLTEYHIPNKQKNLDNVSQKYKEVRNDLISKTLDSIETIKAGRDPNSVLISTLKATGTQLSTDLSPKSSKNSIQPPVHVQYTNPFTKRTEGMILSRETHDFLKNWGQRQVDTQKQLGNLTMPRINNFNIPRINNYTPPRVENYKIPTYKPNFNSPSFKSYNFGRIR